MSVVMRYAISLAVTLHLVVCVGQLCGAAEPVRLAEDGRRIVTDMALDLGDVGTLPNQILIKFVWKNRRGQGLEVSAIVPQCKCTNVKPSKMSIAAGETVYFNADIDVQSAKGRFRAGFSVMFEGGEEPLEFAVTLFRPIRPSASPAKIHFGRRITADAVVRHVQIEAIGDPDPGKLEFGEAVQLKDGRVICRVLSTKTQRIPHPDGDSFLHIATLELKLRRDERRGDLDGVVTVPVRFGEVTQDVRIPFYATFLPEVYTRPNKVIRVIGGSQSEDGVMIRILRDSITRKVSKLTYKASDDRVHVSYEPKPGLENLVVGDLEITFDLRGQQSLDASIDITAESDGRTIKLNVPVKMRVLGREKGSPELPNEH
ncbi:MAG TPA: DUF1573 domain-containing protein [Lacipirellulaceae bacterium]|nr:DUF1573 domain-containing protein [Lacipirellulaceae bacterium]